MQPEPIVATPEPVALKQDEPAGGKPQILDDVVIEEVSIDGMCGVY
ncbi:MAG: mycofactocin precursor [Alphaproteobacteria bacterium]|nr:mycofactocin precursor [Alphaproteobacteria bacterium]